MGLLKASFTDLQKEGSCHLAKCRQKYDDQMEWTAGDPCHGLITRGHLPCELLRGGKCPAYQRFHSLARHKAAGRDIAKAAQTDQGFGGKWTGKTIRQVAKEEGISLGEARRRKAAGKYRS